MKHSTGPELARPLDSGHAMVRRPARSAKSSKLFVMSCATQIMSRSRAMLCRVTMPRSASNPSAVVAQSIEIASGLGEESSRDRRLGVLGGQALAQHGVHDGSTGPTIAVRERVNGLELGMSNRCMHQRLDVGASNEGHEIVDC